MALNHFYLNQVIYEIIADTNAKFLDTRDFGVRPYSMVVTIPSVVDPNTFKPTTNGKKKRKSYRNDFYILN